MKPTWGDLSRTLSELVNSNAEVANIPLDSDQAVVYFTLLGLVQQMREENNGRS